MVRNRVLPGLCKMCGHDASYYQRGVMMEFDGPVEWITDKIICPHACTLISVGTCGVRVPVPLDYGEEFRAGLYSPELYSEGNEKC